MRWVENIEPAKRAINILPNLRQYISKLESKNYKRGEFTIPNCASYQNVKNYCSDPFAKAKLEFFIWFATPIEEFLTKYQTDEPMVPFLVQDLNKMAKYLAGSILKSDVYSEKKNKILSLDLNESKNSKKSARFYFGYKTEKEIKSLKDSKSVKQEEIEKFLDEAGSCVKIFLKKCKKNRQFFLNWLNI